MGNTRTAVRLPALAILFGAVLLLAIVWRVSFAATSTPMQPVHLAAPQQQMAPFNGTSGQNGSGDQSVAHKTSTTQPQTAPPAVVAPQQGSTVNSAVTNGGLCDRPTKPAPMCHQIDGS